MVSTAVVGEELTVHKLAIVDVRTGTVTRNVIAHGVLLARHPSNSGLLRTTAEEWEAFALDIEEVYGEPIRGRANFAARVAQFISVLHDNPMELGENERDRIAAAVYYGFERPVVLGLGYYTITYNHTPTARIELVATVPLYQPGVRPGIDLPQYKAVTLRGVGTLTSRTIGLDLLREGVVNACLKPLDDAARQFWADRGFHGYDPMCTESRQDVAILAERCAETNPDRPDQGDLVAATSPRLASKLRRR